MGEVGEKGMVCVTGGAGFLASWLIMRLLQHGYSVRTTVRSDPKFKEDISHLKTLPGATEKLQIFEADLDKPESFDDAIDGCVGVFLVAHPIELEGKMSKETIIKTSVEGTLGILKSCLRHKVKRAVYTSSVAAAKVIRNIKDIKEIDENIWTEVDIIRKCEGPTFTYAISKTLTERAALEFAEENGLDLVTILPSMIVGPSIAPNLSFSVSKALSLILGLNRDISHLTNLPGASDKLQIFNADLKNPQSFDTAIEGCIGVFLVAYPGNMDQIEIDDVANEMLEEVTLELLRACLKSKTVKRVVYTSSAAAVLVNDKGLMEMDESSWSDVEFCRNVKLPGSSYIITKTLIEQAALKFAEENGLDLVSIIPPMVVGPFICPHLPDSVSMALSIILGNRHPYFAVMQMVHIDDIVSGHIFLFECPNTKGRYICSSMETSVHDIAKFFTTHYPEFELSVNLISEMKEEKPIHLSPEKLLSLGFKFKYDFKDMFDGAIQSCKEKGFL